jgi:hypothetical protein
MCSFRRTVVFRPFGFKNQNQKKKEEEKRTVTSSSAGKTGVENQAKELRL